jgi:hypothetical protein
MASLRASIRATAVHDDLQIIEPKIYLNAKPQSRLCTEKLR